MFSQPEARTRHPCFAGKLQPMVYSSHTQSGYYSNSAHMYCAAIYNVCICTCNVALPAFSSETWPVSGLEMSYTSYRWVYHMIITSPVLTRYQCIAAQIVLTLIVSGLSDWLIYTTCFIASEIES